MTLAAGAKLGSYEILTAIGAGGMGEVYQAHDTKLGRDVAIKVLPEAFAHDADRLSRFQREAKMLASLNHPNIATIYGLEHSGSTHFLIMELVYGETLADRVKSGAFPVEEALKVAAQIAEGLEAAHEKNIVHRDLKPANVKVTPEGRVKVLDFGLAKAFEGDVSNSDLANSPTLTQAATMQGVILGTAAYMSPEQARGKSLDKRTDIWAFGCVLCEMLTGKQTFHGETTTDIIARILTAEPDWHTLPPTVPAQIRVLLKRCLQKDKTLRLRDAGDARIEVQEALATPTAETRLGVGSPPLHVWRRVGVLGLAAAVIAAAAGFVGWKLKSPPPQPVTRTVISLPPGQQLAGLEDGPALALSPDGTHLAYVARQGNTQQLYLRALDSLESKPISGTDDAVNPFFSPDGQWIGFFAAGKLKKKPVGGGAALTLGDVSVPRGASWGRQGMIAFTPRSQGEAAVQQVPDSGGTPQLVTHFEKGETSHRWPEFLPDGKAILFAAAPTALSFTNAQIAVQSLGTSERRDLIQGGTYPLYAPSGHVIYAQGGSLMAVPFDPQRLRTTGAAGPVVEGVLQSPVTGAAQYSISNTGSLVYVSGGDQTTQSKLVWVSRNGVEQPLAGQPHAYGFPRLAPDGRRVAVGILEQESQVWLYDLARETLTRLTFEGNYNPIPVWTPDGKRIAFESNREGTPNLFWQLADGSGGQERLTTSENINAPQSFAPDGQLLAFNEITPHGLSNIWVLRLSDHKAQPFLRTPFYVGAPQFSPEGRWIAYVSDESGRNEIYVQAYPGPGGKYQISTEAGTEPVWNSNGRELFYRNGKKMMAVEIATKPGFTAGTPRMLFEGEYEPAPVIALRNYDVSRDGQRFLMIKSVEQEKAALTQIVVVQNWFEELKRRVPTGK